MGDSRINRLFLGIIAVLMLISGAQAVEESSSGPGPFPGTLNDQVRSLLIDSSGPMLNDGSGGLQRRRVAGEKAPSSLKAIILMCDFSDSLMLGRHGEVEGDFPDAMQTEFYYDAHDSLYFHHQFLNVADYFNAASGGAFVFDFTVHSRTVNLPHPMSFYGNHPEEGEQSISMAAAVVDSLDGEIDFSFFDTVIVIHAGAGEETDILNDSPEQIYSTYLDPGDFQTAFEDEILDQPYIPSADFPDGTGFDHVLILPETEYQDLMEGFGGRFGSLGVYCFELGLRLGMLSLSDFTPSGRPDSQGIGQYGLMGYGLFVVSGWIPPLPCAYNKMLMGWLDPYEIDPTSYSSYQLSPCEFAADSLAAARVNITGQEFFLLAYHQQDPDGNRIFSFSGDLNGNNVPDFYDFDSSLGGGLPDTFPVPIFDPLTDTKERFTDAEWDFFMSDNPAREVGVKGAGSGVYIWHIDEGVIQDVFDSPTNLFNANPSRKAVDLEEADSIQDLDTRVPTAYLLASDDDSFRGEDVDTFGPHTLPATVSAGGVRTGITFENFSNVVLDSSSWILEYADIITFDCFLAENGTDGPVIGARRTMPAGVDLTGSHVLLVDLDGGSGMAEVVVAGAAGEVFVLDKNLDEYMDFDADDSTFEPFALGRQDLQPAIWNQPAAAGDLDGDGFAEIILTSTTGLFAFQNDGTSLRNLGPADFGMYAALDTCRVAPVVFSASGGSYSRDDTARVCVVVQRDDLNFLEVYSGIDADLLSLFPLGAGEILASPVFAWNHLLVAVRDTVNQDHRLLAVELEQGLLLPAENLKVLELGLAPGKKPLVYGHVNDAVSGSDLRYVVIVSDDGAVETLVFDAGFRSVQPNIPWNDRIPVESGMAPGGAFCGGGVFGRAGHNGEWLTGWPQGPSQPAKSPLSGYGVTPLLAELRSSDFDFMQYLFPTLDGRIYGYGDHGEDLFGLPVVGAGRVSATAAIGNVSATDFADLVAVGTFSRIDGLNAEGEELATTTVSEVVLWASMVENDSPWPMWGGSPWRNGYFDPALWVVPPGISSGDGLVGGSHLCYPSPLSEGPLMVRGILKSNGKVRAYIYNLQGEEIVSTMWQYFSAREPFAIEVELERVVSGLYLCRLVAETGGVTDISVVQFAVVR